MANTLAVLNGLLDTALRDTSDVTWSSDEKDQLIRQAVEDCPPRPLRYGDATFTLTEEDYLYDYPPGVVSISRLEIADADGVPQGEIAGGLWESFGDPQTGNGEIRIAPAVVNRWGTGATVSVIGYGRYDTDTNLIPDEYIPFVLAHARAAAYGAMASDRARFRNWETDEQPHNVSVNELVLLINDAQAERDRQAARIFRYRKPMPAMRSR